ncbi:protein PIN-LIKES 6, partial [Tanacetum coccineum]
GNLTDGPESSKLGLRTTAAIIIGRLIFVLAVRLGIVMTVDNLGLLQPNDKMFRFILLLQHSMPKSYQRFSMMLLEHQNIAAEFCSPSWWKELSKESGSKILPCGDGSCWKTFKPIAILIAKGKLK